MNRVSEEVLNMTIEESVGYGVEYQKKIIADQDEYKRINKEIQAYFERNDESEILSFFQKLKPVGHTDYQWMYITSRLFKKDDDALPSQRILIACPVNLMGDMAGKVNRVLEENEFMKKNFKKFALLTKREKEILQLVAQGNNNPSIAEMLFISRHTVEQHRKNINSKIQCKNFAELVQFAVAFDMIG
jgi:DNA-binding CsgD family transcriptional regulator